MILRSLRSLPLLAALLAGLLARVLLVAGRSSGERVPSSLSASAVVTESLDHPAQIVGMRRVNAPYSVSGKEYAIFWFGRVTPTENSVDIRVGYHNDHLRIWVSAFDRRLWYDTSPSPDDLTSWDAVTLYLDTDANMGDVPDANTYRFDAQLVWWEPRDDYQAAYRGNGGGWVRATIPFTTTSGWRGNEPNDDVDDRGWVLTYYIPFARRARPRRRRRYAHRRSGVARDDGVTTACHVGAIDLRYADLQPSIHRSRRHCHRPSGFGRGNRRGR
jgi:hypothetical protein